MPITVAETISDPISWEAAKAIIDYQSTLIYFYVGFVGLVFAVVTVVWWLVNWRRVTVGLSRAVQSAKSKAKDTVDAVIDKFEDKMSAQLSTQKKDSEEFRELMAEQRAEFEYNNSKLMAISASGQKSFGYGAYWWLETVVNANRLIKQGKTITLNESALRNAVDEALECLNNAQDLKALDAEDVKNMRQCIKTIRPFFDEEKKRIESKLNELVKKTPSLSRKHKVS